MSERLSLASVNPGLTCTLCKGYFVNAMTLVRCMHSFCKSCINRHLDTSSACPTCQERVFRSRMDDFMIPDDTLQSIVYKSVPGLYANEMRRRREFYRNRDKPSKSGATNGSGGSNADRTEEKGYPERSIFTNDDMISLVLEHSQEEEEARQRSLKLSNINIECAAVTPVTVLIRFIQNKFAPPDSLTVHFRLEGISTAKSKQILLDPDFRLLDVCYIADYRATEPLKLLYSFVQFDPSLRDPPKRLNPMAVDPAPRVVKSDSDKAHRSISSNGNSIPYFTKPEVRTKSIDMSKGSLITAANNGVNVDAILSPMKTYSRSSLAPLNLALSDNDSTEEECDNWDSAVSTTIDSVTNHHQKSVKPQAALQERKNADSKTPPPRTVQASAPSPAKLTQNVPLSSIQPVQNQNLNVSRAQSFGKDRREGSASLPNSVVSVKRHSATSKLSNGNASRQRVIKTVNQIEKKLASVHSQQNRVSKGHTVSSGKRPTVLKIKLNTSSTESETFTITSPTPRDTRSSTLADRLAAAGSVTGSSSALSSASAVSPTSDDVLMRPLSSARLEASGALNGPQTRSKSPSPTARDSRAAFLDAKKRRRMEEDELRKIEEDRLKAKRAKKRDERERKKPLINEVPAVFEQHEGLLDATSFGCRSSVLCWESQLRIPAPLTVPLTVTLARKKTEGSETKQIEKMNSLQGREAFLRNNFGLEKNPNPPKGAALRWVKPQAPNVEVKVKLPPPDFEMSDTLREVMEAMAEDNAKVQSPPQPPPPREPESKSSVKFSINSILSGEVGHRKESPSRPVRFWNEIQISIEMYISHMSRFFWLLESCPKASPVLRSRILAACHSKTFELSRILEILRNLSGSSAKNQIDRVLELSALIEKYVSSNRLASDDSVPRANKSDIKLKTEKKYYDLNRNQMPSNAVVLNVGTTPKRSLGESVAFPVAAATAAERQLHELIVKSTDAASKIPGMTTLEQTKLFDLISIKRSSSVSSLNTSDGSENFGDCEIDQHRWEDVELPPTMRSWPDCSTEA